MAPHQSGLKIPRHVAIIMDGNGRWAKQQGENRIYGHQEGVHSVREVVEACGELGIAYLTLYTFSTENWNRPQEEVDALMRILVASVSSETPHLISKGVKLEVIGDMESLPKECQEELLSCISQTAHNQRVTLILALSYSSRWEITQAVKKIIALSQAGKIKPEAVTYELIESHLHTKNYPEPVLMIRTSGEHRISNFLLWQLAYAEFYFTPVLWPDFRKPQFYEAIKAFQERERRYGKTSEQIKA